MKNLNYGVTIFVYYIVMLNLKINIRNKMKRNDKIILTNMINKHSNYTQCFTIIKY